MPEFRDKVEFENVLAVAETPLAVLCRIDEVEHWIPQSQIDANSEVWHKGDEGKLVISEWIALEKKLI